MGHHITHTGARLPALQILHQALFTMETTRHLLSEANFPIRQHVQSSGEATAAIPGAPGFVQGV